MLTNFYYSNEARLAQYAQYMSKFCNFQKNQMERRLILWFSYVQAGNFCTKIQEPH